MPLKQPTKPWWETDTYDIDAIPEFEELAGAQGVALVKAYDDGRTQSGWGLTGPNGTEGFAQRYERGEFIPRRALYGYNKGNHAVAYVMRSVRLVAIDIDGKNGGLEHVTEIGALPLTMAERSKSGNGYHLFYETDDVWDVDEGFAQIPDQIGFVQGVDIRGTGCVYHFPAQRWNNRKVTKLPDWLRDQLLAKQQRMASQTSVILKTLSTMDETEILLMQGNLLEDLKKPIPQGKRNTTLFAIGSQMKLAEVPDWELAIQGRAAQLGLSHDEGEKIVSNIENYAR